MARVLVLEPDRELRELFSLQLATMGHDAVTDDSAPDAVLVEPADPAMRARALELRAERHELPIVCATIVDDKTIAHDLRPTCFLVKPFPAERLRKALASALESA